MIWFIIWVNPHTLTRGGCVFPVMMHSFSRGSLFPWSLASSSCCVLPPPAPEKPIHVDAHPRPPLSFTPHGIHELQPAGCAGRWRFHPFAQPASASARLPHLLKCFPPCWNPMLGDSLAQDFIDLPVKMLSALYVWVYKTFRACAAVLWAFCHSSIF